MKTLLYIDVSATHSPFTPPQDAHSVNICPPPRGLVATALLAQYGASASYIIQAGLHV